MALELCGLASRRFWQRHCVIRQEGETVEEGRRYSTSLSGSELERTGSLR